MFAISGRAQLAFDCDGAPDGADVLLIHAGVTDRRSWRHVVERLRPRHRCVAYDMRGYGETVCEPEDGWSPVADALVVLDAAGVERAAIVGCSRGGQTAIDLTLAHPHRAAGLVLIGSGVSGAPYPELEQGPTAELNARFDAAEAAGDIDEVGRLGARMWLDGPMSDEGRVGGEVRELFFEMNRRALTAEDPGEQDQPAPAWPRLSDIAVPTLVMVGRLDAEDIQPISEQAGHLIPGATLMYLDGVAHLPHLEGDTTTIDAIAEFVDTLSV